jgi:hypothetical protein
VIGVRRRRRLAALFLGFAVWHGIAIVVLWYASPLFWGHIHCQA